MPHHFFSLKLTPPFDRLSDGELILLANLALERRYDPSAVVCQGGQPLRYLYVTVGGRLWMGGADLDPWPLPAVVGYESLLFNRAIAADLFADPQDGAICLLFRKETFFTMAYECPALILGFCHTPSDRPSLLLS
jgi:signal-transduction protein with cAMP-binding, CBS, and nucleotidyltransferase domain